MADLFNVIIEGQTKPGVDAREVKQRLAGLLKTDYHVFSDLFANAPTVIRKNVDRETAEKYLAVIEKAGAVCRIVPIATGHPTGPKTEDAPPPHPPVKPSGAKPVLHGATRDGVIVTNIESVPGKTIVAHYGVVAGSTIRAKHVGRDIMASLKNIVGGELKGYTELLKESRRQAMDRMIEQAKQLQANAVINVRFSTSSVAQGAAELYVYGTAVRVE